MVRENRNCSSIVSFTWRCP